jgi:hypothetical protein
MTETEIEGQTLELEFWRPEQVPAAYLGPHLRAVIRNRGECPLRIQCVRLVGCKSQTEVVKVTEAPVTVRAGQSVSYAITLTWGTGRRLRREAAVVLEVEVEGDDGQSARSDALEIEDVETWTPAEEVKAALGTLLVGVVWLFIMWGALLKLPHALRTIAWPLAALFTVLVCSQFYARLWRGDSMWGTALTVGLQRRVGPLTDVLLTSVAVWVLLTAPFAFVTYLIDGHNFGVGAAGTLFTGERERYFEAIGLYAWHAVDVLPFIQATTTLHWTEPVQDYSRATGALLVLYKALVLAPVVAASVAAWRGRARREPRTQDGPGAFVHEQPEAVRREPTLLAAEPPAASRSDA